MAISTMLPPTSRLLVVLCGIVLLSTGFGVPVENDFDDAKPLADNLRDPIVDMLSEHSKASWNRDEGKEYLCCCCGRYHDSLDVIEKSWWTNSCNAAVGHDCVDAGVSIHGKVFYSRAARHCQSAGYC